MFTLTRLMSWVCTMSSTRAAVSCRGLRESPRANLHVQNILEKLLATLPFILWIAHYKLLTNMFHNPFKWNPKIFSLDNNLKWILLLHSQRANVHKMAINTQLSTQLGNKKASAIHSKSWHSLQMAWVSNVRELFKKSEGLYSQFFPHCSCQSFPHCSVLNIDTVVSSNSSANHRMATDSRL